MTRTPEQRDHGPVDEQEPQGEDLGHFLLRGNAGWHGLLRGCADQDPMAAPWAIAADYAEDYGYTLLGFMLRAGDPGHVYTPELTGQPMTVNYAGSFTVPQVNGWPVPQGTESFLYDLPQEDRLRGGTMEPGTLYRFRQGLVDSLTCRAAFWWEHGPTIVGHVYSAIRAVELRELFPSDFPNSFTSIASTVLTVRAMRRQYLGHPQWSDAERAELSKLALEWAVAEYGRQQNKQRAEAWGDASEG